MSTRYYPNWWGSAGGGGGGGGGSVTTVSVTTANGVSGTVTNPTTTPAITLTLGDITPTSIENRNGLSGTAIKVFKTYTSTTNYEGLQIDGGLKTATEFSISTVVGGGGGTQRALSLYGGAGLWLESVANNVTVNASSAFQIRTNSNNRWQVMSTGMFQPNSPNAVDVGATGAEVRSGYFATSLVLSSAATLAWNADTILQRDAAQTLALRNGANGQRFKVFNTYNGTNDEWFDVDWVTTANKCKIGTNKSGIATARILEILVGGTAAAQFDSSSNFYPVTNNGPSCGISGNRWNTGWFQTKVQIGASAADVILTGEASGVLQLGQDSGTPAAQRIKAFDGSGTSISGSDLELAGGQSTGNVLGGSVIVKTSPAGGSSNSTPNAYVTQLTITGANDWQVNRTFTAAGTTGAQTINKAFGSVNFAAAATTLVVTNSLVTTSSIIFLTIGTNDTTMKSVTYTAAAGSFTITANAAATAETRVNFWVIN